MRQIVLALVGLWCCALFAVGFPQRESALHSWWRRDLGVTCSGDCADQYVGHSEWRDVERARAHYMWIVYRPLASSTPLALTESIGDPMTVLGTQTIPWPEGVEGPSTDSGAATTIDEPFMQAKGTP